MLSFNALAVITRPFLRTIINFSLRLQLMAGSKVDYLSEIEAYIAVENFQDGYFKTEIHMLVKIYNLLLVVGLVPIVVH